jgi:hypothetical protein
MRRLQALSLAGAVFLTMAASACGGDSSPPSSRITGQSPRPTVATGSRGLAGVGTPKREITAEDFDPKDFSDPTTIDNAWFPLIPGTQFVYEGQTVEDGERTPHRVVFTVTDLTKVVNGIRTLVIWDRDYSAGQLEETELALFAQDDSGNVWHFGQYPEEYEEGKFVAAPAWIAGYEGARPGISMKASPHLGGSSYSQGYAPPPIGWVDHARVSQMEIGTCVPFGCFQGVLVTEEFEPSKPDAYQLKYYAPGVGNVRVGWRGEGEDQRETLGLVKVIQLRGKALQKVRAAALALERRAYQISKDVYGRTSPAEY